MAIHDSPIAGLIWQAILALNRAARRRAIGGDGLSALADEGPGPNGSFAVREGRHPDATLHLAADGAWASPLSLDDEATTLCDLYLPLCAAASGRRYAMAHLGQTLDGRIATTAGASHWVTGEADILHNHRVRALASVVVVGAGTVRSDDPQLTVRRCAGPNPVRAVVDSGRRLGRGHRLFTDGAARTLVLCAEELARAGDRPGEAELVGVPDDGDGLHPRAILDALAARGLDLVFVEGGGVTVSRFLEAGALDRLQVTVAPLILGSGRPSITLGEVDSLAGALRPRTRRFLLGEDVLFDCVLRP